MGSSVSSRERAARLVWRLRVSRLCTRCCVPSIARGVGGDGGNGLTGETEERRVRPFDNGARATTNESPRRRPFGTLVRGRSCPVGRLRRQSNGRSVLVPLGVDHALYAFDQPIDVKVNQQPHWQVCESQIRQDLRLMNRQYRGECLYLHYHETFDEEIEAVGTVESDAFVHQWNAALRSECHASYREFVLQAPRKRGFE